MQKIKTLFVLMLLVFISPLGVLANYVEPEVTSSQVNSITVSGSGSDISWTIDGYSAKGFKVAWSKNPSPTYPIVLAIAQTRLLILLQFQEVVQIFLGLLMVIRLKVLKLLGQKILVQHIHANI